MMWNEKKRKSDGVRDSLSTHESSMINSSKANVSNA